MRLVLIRHGQTPSNVSGLLDTRVPGPGLTGLGLEQAAALPRALADEDISAIYVSTMVRTHLTAAHLAAARRLETIERPGVREITSGDLEMRSDHDSVMRYMSTVFDWTRGELDRRIPGGESGAEFLDRFDDVIAEAASGDHEAVAVVSHGAAIRTWMSLRGRNVPSDFIMHNPLHNTGVVVADGTPDAGWEILSFMGEAIGGDRVESAAAGPAGEPVAQD
ncbi:histidine phosphatase family protein [Microbacterium elymi]|uniref:Histidine phosphatase family protein n=1 Tax=Microbacterium elymi TaxID=2909587 RepID=A0ABY5NMY3_9MICO|nr:histidine phosphatase family protein [Microbacterium elymi]UUT36479.1 histidine phosphatase family protein [Microbacterium elymi]